MPKPINPSSNHNQPVRCPQCQALVTKATLNHHITNVHAQATPFDNIKMPVVGYQYYVNCTVCGAQVTQKRLVKHVAKVHHQILINQPYQIPSAKTKSLLEPFNQVSNELSVEPTRLDNSDISEPELHPRSIQAGKPIRLNTPKPKSRTSVRTSVISFDRLPPKMFTIDESGFIIDTDHSQKSSKMKANLTNTTLASKIPNPTRQKDRIEKSKKHTLCLICGQIDDNIGLHLYEIHNLALIKDGRYQCRECQAMFDLSEVKDHACIKTSQSVPQQQKLKKTTSPVQNLYRKKVTKINPQNTETIRCIVCGYYHDSRDEHERIYHKDDLGTTTCRFSKTKLNRIRKKEDHYQRAHGIRVISREENRSERGSNPRLILCLVCGDRLHPFEVQKHAKFHGSRIAELNRAAKQKTKADNQLDEKYKLPGIQNNEDHMDGGKYLGWMAREKGQFGSFPLHDDYSDESDAD